jgi:hypothetical protein
MAGGFGDMQKMMKQLQKMQADMAKMQEELSQRTVEATSGGGVVRVVANGQHEVKEIKIDVTVIDPNEPELLEDLVLAAVNEALRKAQDMVSAEMGKLTGGMKLPGVF